MSILTVTTPAASYDLTTAALVADELGIALANVVVARVPRWITAESARFAAACGRVLVSETVSETFAFDRSRWDARAIPLQLQRWPVSSVASVTADGATLTADADYALDAAAGQLRRINASGDRVPWACASVTVAYTGGYDPIPADVQDAVITLVRHRWYSTGRDPSLRSLALDGVSTEQFWVGAAGDVGDMPPSVAAVVDRYREIPI